MPLIRGRRLPQLGDPALERAFQSLYDDINSILEGIQRPSHVGNPRGDEGKPGDIRLTMDPGGQFFLQARYKEGWVSSAKNAFQFMLNENARPEIVITGGGLTSTPGKPVVFGLSETGVIPGSYTRTNLTVDAFGRITTAANGGGSGQITSAAGAGIVAVTLTGQPNANYIPDGFLLTSTGEKSLVIPQIPPLTDSRTAGGFNMRVFEAGTLYTWVLSI
jgi:hypothetical protein